MNHVLSTTPRRRWAPVLLAATALVATACAAPADPAPPPIPSTGEQSGPAATAQATVVLRVGPLETQNVLRLCLDSGELATRLGEVGAVVEVTAPFPAFAPAAEAMSAGHIDMTSSGATGVVTARQGAAEPVIFAVERNDGDTQGIVATGASGIVEVADLAGRRIAVNQGGTGDYLARLALREAGMSADDVELVPLGPADAATAFTAGQVDAWATWDQFLVAARQQPGARVVALSRDIGATNPSVHVVSEEFLAAHPEVVVATFEALRSCALEVVADPQILADAYLDAGAPGPVAAEIARLRPPQIERADAGFAADLTALSDFYAEQGLTDGVVDVSGAAVDVDGLR